MNNILITGGAGFIGANLVSFFVKKYPTYNIFNLDSLTYASDINNLFDIENQSNYTFIHGDINNFNFIYETFKKYKINKVIHLAAESHVDNSIKNPLIFAKTNVIGTLNLLSAAKLVWGDNFTDNLFYHISTDEVFGSLGVNGFFKECSKYAPNSPYSASKASSDHFVRSFGVTHNLPIIISNCSNNFGPFQNSEKLIPKVIYNILNNKEIPIYGKGNNIRDWIFVDDHINAIDIIFHSNKIGETYCIGAGNELENIELVKILISISDSILGRKKDSSLNLISLVNDRKGHDFRYAVDFSKISKELGWKPITVFENAIFNTVNWYLNKYKS